MTSSLPPAGHPAQGRWRQRLAAPTVTFPTWSAHRPQRLFFISDDGGSTQGWVLERSTGDRVRLTGQTVGVESLVVLPDGSGAAWWTDDTGAEYGSWVVTDSGVEYGTLARLWGSGPRDVWVVGRGGGILHHS